MTTASPGERICAAFGLFAPAALGLVGAELKTQPQPFLAQLGVALTETPSVPFPGVVARLRIERALHEAQWNGAGDLLEAFGDAEPWLTVRDCLNEALETPQKGATPHE